MTCTGFGKLATDVGNMETLGVQCHPKTIVVQGVAVSASMNTDDPARFESSRAWLA